MDSPNFRVVVKHGSAPQHVHNVYAKNEEQAIHLAKAEEVEDICMLMSISYKEHYIEDIQLVEVKPIH